MIFLTDAIVSWHVFLTSLSQCFSLRVYFKRELAGLSAVAVVVVVIILFFRFVAAHKAYMLFTELSGTHAKDFVWETESKRVNGKIYEETEIHMYSHTQY